MVFRPRVQKLSSDVVEGLLDDVLEIAVESQNKEQIRCKYFNASLKRALNCSKLISSEEINDISYALKNNPSSRAIERILKQTSIKLNTHYSELVSIFNKLR